MYTYIVFKNNKLINDTFKRSKPDNLVPKKKKIEFSCE